MPMIKPCQMSAKIEEIVLNLKQATKIATNLFIDNVLEPRLDKFR